jgi:hypothetical protein
VFFDINRAIMSNSKPISAKVSADATGLRMDASPTSEQRGTAAPTLRRRTRAGKTKLASLDSLDGRTSAAQATRRHVQALIDDLTADRGGPDRLSQAERELCTRAALLGTLIADYEARLVAGEPVQLSEYLAAVSVQRRVLVSLGIRRVEPKNIDELDSSDPAIAIYKQHLYNGDSDDEEA